ncbi:MAG: hypothetical protein M3R14_03490 [Acidobacteriota bacterium]|nr:hypothetical protein [Acidobacteriota bacterium]
MNKPKSWQNIGRDKRREIYNTLRGCLPGERWLNEMLQFTQGSEMQKLSAVQSLNRLNQVIRFMILNDAVSGKPFSIAASQERYERRVRLIRARARRIAAETGVSFDKVYPKLYVKMYKHI